MEATLRMDTDKDLITIERKNNIKFSVPQRTEIKLSEVTNVEHKFFGAVIIRGTGAFRFVYPGCPTGGSMLTGFSTNENMVQYSGKHKPEADAFIAALVPIVKANRARLQA
jgi:hypothetical protein